MFALIKTNGATHIAIYIPQQGAEKSLPALIGMLEHNSVFINKGWQTLETVKPETTILLGNTITEDHRDSELLLTIPVSEDVIDDSFVLATPDVFVSNKKATEKAAKELSQLRTELEHTKSLLQRAQETVNALVSPGSED